MDAVCIRCKDTDLVLSWRKSYFCPTCDVCTDCGMIQSDGFMHYDDCKPTPPSFFESLTDPAEDTPMTPEELQELDDLATEYHRELFPKVARK